jgi:hypothetical protein
MSDEKPPSNGDERIRRELERIAFGPAESGREALAKVTALRTLERLNRGEHPLADPERPNDNPAAVERLFDPQRDPKARVEADDWYPFPDDEFKPLDDRAHTVEDRRRWYRNARRGAS